MATLDAARRIQLQGSLRVRWIAVDAVRQWGPVYKRTRKLSGCHDCRYLYFW